MGWAARRGSLQNYSEPINLNACTLSPRSTYCKPSPDGFYHLVAAFEVEHFYRRTYGSSAERPQQFYASQDSSRLPRL